MSETLATAPVQAESLADLGLGEKISSMVEDTNLTKNIDVDTAVDTGVDVDAGVDEIADVALTKLKELETRVQLDSTLVEKGAEDANGAPDAAVDDALVPSNAQSVDTEDVLTTATSNGSAHVVDVEKPADVDEQAVAAVVEADPQPISGGDTGATPDEDATLADAGPVIEKPVEEAILAAEDPIASEEVVAITEESAAAEEPVTAAEEEKLQEELRADAPEEAVVPVPSESELVESAQEEAAAEDSSSVPPIVKEEEELVEEPVVQSADVQTVVTAEGVEDSPVDEEAAKVEEPVAADEPAEVPESAEVEETAVDQELAEQPLEGEVASSDPVQESVAEVEPQVEAETEKEPMHTIEVETAAGQEPAEQPLEEVASSDLVPESAAAEVEPQVEANPEPEQAIDVVEDAITTQQEETVAADETGAEEVLTATHANDEVEVDQPTDAEIAAEAESAASETAAETAPQVKDDAESLPARTESEPESVDTIRTETEEAPSVEGQTTVSIPEVEEESSAPVVSVEASEEPTAVEQEQAPAVENVTEDTPPTEVIVEASEEATAEETEPLAAVAVEEAKEVAEEPVVNIAPESEPIDAIPAEPETEPETPTPADIEEQVAESVVPDTEDAVEDPAAPTEAVTEEAEAEVVEPLAEVVVEETKEVSDEPASVIAPESEPESVETIPTETEGVSEAQVVPAVAVAEEEAPALVVSTEDSGEEVTAETAAPVTEDVVEDSTPVDVEVPVETEVAEPELPAEPAVEETEEAVEEPAVAVAEESEPEPADTTSTTDEEAAETQANPSVVVSEEEASIPVADEEQVVVEVAAPNAEDAVEDSVPAETVVEASEETELPAEAAVESAAAVSLEASNSAEPALEPPVADVSEDAEDGAEDPAPVKFATQSEVAAETSGEPEVPAEAEAETDVAPVVDAPSGAAPELVEETFPSDDVTEPVVEATIEDINAVPTEERADVPTESVKDPVEAVAGEAIVESAPEDVAVEEDAAAEPSAVPAPSEVDVSPKVITEPSVDVVPAAEEAVDSNELANNVKEVALQPVLQSTLEEESIETPLVDVQETAPAEPVIEFESEAPVSVEEPENEPLDSEAVHEVEAEIGTPEPQTIIEDAPKEAEPLAVDVSEEAPSADVITSLSEVVEEAKLEDVEGQTAAAAPEDEEVEQPKEVIPEQSAADGNEEDAAAEVVLTEEADLKGDDVKEEEASPVVSALPEQAAVDSVEGTPAETAEAVEVPEELVSATVEDEILPVSDEVVPAEEADEAAAAEQVQTAVTAQDEDNHTVESEVEESVAQAAEAESPVQTESAEPVDAQEGVASDTTGDAESAPLVLEEAAIAHADHSAIDVISGIGAVAVVDELSSKETPVTAEESIPDVQVEMPTPSSETFPLEEDSGDDVDPDASLEQRLADAAGIPVDQVPTLPAILTGADSTPGENIVPVVSEEEVRTPTKADGEFTAIQGDEAKQETIVPEGQEFEKAAEPVVEEEDVAEAQEEVSVPASSLSVNTNVTDVPERPKSPWTPSYSVTMQGPGISNQPEEVEEEVISAHEDTMITDSVEQTQESQVETLIPEGSVPVISELEAQQTDSEGVLATPSQDVTAIDTSNLVEATQEIERPKSPYPPSYSVTQMGPGIGEAAEETYLADDEATEPEAEDSQNSLKLHLDVSSLESVSSIRTPESVDGSVSGASSNIPEVSSSPRSDFGILTPGFDSRSEVSDASREPIAPSTPRTDPEAIPSDIEMQTPVATGERGLPTDSPTTPLRSPLAPDDIQGGLKEAVSDPLDVSDSSTSAFDGDVDTDVQASSVDSWVKEIDIERNSEVESNPSETGLTPSEAVGSDDFSLVVDIPKEAIHTGLDASPVVVPNPRRDTISSEAESDLVMVSDVSLVSTKESLSESMSELDTIRGERSETVTLEDIPAISTAVPDLAIPRLDVQPIVVTTTFSKDSLYTQVSDFASPSGQTGTNVTTPDVETLTMPKIDIGEGSEAGSIEPLGEDDGAYTSYKVTTVEGSASPTPRGDGGGSKSMGVAQTLAMKTFPSAFTSTDQTAAAQQSKVLLVSEDRDAVEELSPPINRRRLESTTSSLIFPGGWVASPTHERPSLEVATGVFSKPQVEGVSATAAAVVVSPVAAEPEAESKKWRCVIM